MSVPKYDFDIYFALAFTLALIIITYLLTKRFKRSTNVVLLTGLSGCGKTAIFSKIIFNKPRKSVTSLKENEANLEEFNLTLIDLPGADRLRDSYWEQYRTKAKHVIFIVDSATIVEKLRDVSECLYKLLSDGTLYKNKIKFTIACNKQDLEDAKGKDEIKLMIEKELHAIKETRRGQLMKTSNEEDEDYLTSEQIYLYLNQPIEISVHNLEQLIKLIL